MVYRFHHIPSWFLGGCLLSFSMCCLAMSQELQQGNSTNSTSVLRLPPEPLSKPSAPLTHPLRPVLLFANQHLRYIQRSVDDYTCLLVKRERIDGELLAREYAEVKCRHGNEEREVPFSVYMRFLGPADLAGREALYVAGRDRGDVLIRKGGKRNAFLNLWLEPRGETAMRQNRYPITAFGIQNLLERLIEVGESELQYGESEVRYFRNTRFEDRECTGIEVEHPVQRDHFRYHRARILIDNELHIPIYFAAYDWPTEPGQPPLLTEEYIYRDIKLNVGLQDADFDRLNPDYGFRKQ